MIEIACINCGNYKAEKFGICFVCAVDNKVKMEVVNNKTIKLTSSRNKNRKWYSNDPERCFMVVPI